MRPGWPESFLPLSRSLIHSLIRLSSRGAADPRQLWSSQVTDGPGRSRTPERTLGKRVGGNPSGVRISYPPPPLTRQYTVLHGDRQGSCGGHRGGSLRFPRTPARGPACGAAGGPGVGLSARTIARRYAGRSTTCAHPAEASCRNCGDHVENPVSVLVDGLQRATCSVAVAIVGVSAAGMGHVGVPPGLDAARTAG